MILFFQVQNPAADDYAHVITHGKTGKGAYIPMLAWKCERNHLPYLQFDYDREAGARSQIVCVKFPDSTLDEMMKKFPDTKYRKQITHDEAKAFYQAGVRNKVFSPYLESKLLEVQYPDGIPSDKYEELCTPDYICDDDGFGAYLSQEFAKETAIKTVKNNL